MHITSHTNDIIVKHRTEYNNLSNDILIVKNDYDLTKLQEVKVNGICNFIWEKLSANKFLFGNKVKI